MKLGALCPVNPRNLPTELLARKENVDFPAGQSRIKEEASQDLRLATTRLSPKTKQHGALHSIGLERTLEYQPIYASPRTDARRRLPDSRHCDDLPQSRVRRREPAPSSMEIR